MRALKPAALYLFFPSLLLMIGKLFRKTDMTTAEFIRVSGNFYYAAGTFGTFFVLYRTAGKRGTSVFEEVSLHVKGVSLKRLFCICMAGLGMGFLASLVLTLISSAVLPLTGYQEISTGAFQGRDLWLLFFTIGISAPVVEEIIFRGYMYRQLRTGFSRNTAVLISSAVFAIFHVSPIWICYAFVFSLFLSYLAEKEKNTIFPVGFHVGINLSSVILWGIIESAKNSFLWG